MPTHMTPREVDFAFETKRLLRAGKRLERAMHKELDKSGGKKQTRRVTIKMIDAYCAVRNAASGLRCVLERKR